ncbi:hypothetical protein EI94DRAFT_1800167 [Lactarius quietus]|nr:hypothetical protein EI94DRAFT_1835238 [Lactarius quietus]KAF8268648.1 hypothetical protein EI94DRAFT_1800167 [Lactarius quietus]
MPNFMTSLLLTRLVVTVNSLESYPPAGDSAADLEASLKSAGTTPNFISNVLEERLSITIPALLSKPRGQVYTKRRRNTQPRGDMAIWISSSRPENWEQFGGISWMGNDNDSI